MLSTVSSSLSLVLKMTLIFERQFRFVLFRFVPLSQVMGPSIYLLCDLSLHTYDGRHPFVIWYSSYLCFSGADTLLPCLASHAACPALTAYCPSVGRCM